MMNPCIFGVQPASASMAYISRANLLTYIDGDVYEYLEEMMMVMMTTTTTMTTMSVMMTMTMMNKI